MNSINLLIANADGSLDENIDKVKRAFEKASDQVVADLNLNKVDVVCLMEPEMTIPEIGIGGYTPNRHLVYLYLDPSKDLDENEIFYTLCHELHHAKRYDGPGYGKTLFDSIIFEGLATAYENEISEGKAFIPKDLLSRKNTKELVAKHSSEFQSTEFEHYKWFIFDNSKQLPRWAGYEIGFYIVTQYLSETNKKASELVLEGPNTFM